MIIKVSTKLDQLIKEEPDMLKSVISHFNMKNHYYMIDNTKKRLCGEYTMLIEDKNIEHVVLFNNFKNKGRNSRFVQFLPPFLTYKNNGKKCFYIVNKSSDDVTAKSVFIYSILNSVGFKMINNSIEFGIKNISNIYDFIYEKSRFINKGNHSTTIKENEKSIYIYAKSGGAETGEALLTAYFCSFFIPNKKIKLFQYNDGIQNKFTDKQLSFLKNINISVDLEIKPKNFLSHKYKKIEEENFRNQPKFLKNLYKKWGKKKTCICCLLSDNSNIASHIERQTDINKNNLYSNEEKIEKSISSENGIFLCRNHDIAFEKKFFSINSEGFFVFNNNISNENLDYIKELILRKTFHNMKIEDIFITNKMIEHLKKHQNNNFFISYEDFCKKHNINL